MEATKPHLALEILERGSITPPLTFENVYLALSCKGYEMRLENQGDAEGDDYLVYRILSWDLVEVAEVGTLAEASQLALTLPDDFENVLTPEQQNILNTISEDAFHQYIRIQKDGSVDMGRFRQVMAQAMHMECYELVDLSRLEYMLILTNYQFLLDQYGEGEA